MQVIHRINEIEQRARALNLTLSGLCRIAGVPYVTVWRWQAGDVSPTERKASLHLGKLDERLRRRERALRRALSCRHAA